MNTRVLLVDDDSALLQAYQRRLGSIGQAEAVSGPAAALEAITTRGPYAVIVVGVGDSRVDGIPLLVEVGQRAPQTVRIALTAGDDSRTAMAAVNVARVFRLISRAGVPDVFEKTVREAIAEHEVRQRQDRPNDSAVPGLVSAFAKQLTVAAPGTYGFGERLRDRACDVAVALGREKWQDLEAAATLLRVGLTVLPVALLARHHENKPLTSSEAELLRRVPELGGQLLDNVPPLAGVAEIVRYQCKGFDGSGSPADGVLGSRLPLGARVLRPLVDLLMLEDSGVPIRIAAQKLERDARRYDPEVLLVISRLAADWAAGPKPWREAAMVGDLRPGMELDCDVVISSGVRLVACGTSLSPALIERLRNFADLGQVAEPLFVIRTPVMAAA